MQIVPSRGGNLKVCFVDSALPSDDVRRSNGVTICIPRGLSRTLDGKRVEVLRTAEGDRLILFMGANGSHPAP